MDMENKIWFALWFALKGVGVWCMQCKPNSVGGKAVLPENW